VGFSSAAATFDGCGGGVGLGFGWQQVWACIIQPCLPAGDRLTLYKLQLEAAVCFARLCNAATAAWSMAEE